MKKPNIQMEMNIIESKIYYSITYKSTLTYNP